MYMNREDNMITHEYLAFNCILIHLHTIEIIQALLTSKTVQ